VVLLFSLVARIGQEIGEREGREERMRLSRELHDGLAQQLSLLYMRIDRADELKRTPERRQQDLEAARRLVEAALMEVRQAITALRRGTIAWEEFDRTVRALADEFALTSSPWINPGDSPFSWSHRMTWWVVRASQTLPAQTGTVLPGLHAQQRVVPPLYRADPLAIRAEPGYPHLFELERFTHPSSSRWNAANVQL
jgi:hypothetical protein